MLEKMKELVRILNEAAKAYYQQDREIMSNQQYDAYYDQLERMEKEMGIILSNSPTQKVGYHVLSSLQKVRHDSRMLSLDKTKEVSKLKSWLGEQEGLLSWKLDGLTIVLKYLNGNLMQAITRGNGEIGEDVTHNAKVFKNLPLRIQFQGELVIRGEAIISYDNFQKINENLPAEEQYKNPRNLCSGTVRQLNSEIAAKRNVQFFAFHMVRAERMDFQDQKSNQLLWLAEQGFEVVEYTKVHRDILDETIKVFADQIGDNPFGSDGLVLTYNQISYGESLGSTSKFPRDSIAFKWADEMKETRLLNIQWNTSRTGLINPIAVFEPVELEGTTVNKASVHNLSVLEELELGVGDVIKVYKANMIIPQIAENMTRSKGVTAPGECPVCHGETEVRQVREGKALYCTNPNCRAQLVRSLSHYVSRDAANIEGLSEATIEKFVEKGFIKNYTDLYRLEQYEQEIKAMEGFGQKSYQNLIQAVEKSKDMELPNLIYALGINQVGLSNAKLLAQHYGYSLADIMKATQEELVEIEGFGSIIAHSIYAYFAQEGNIQMIQNVLQYLRLQKSTKESQSAELKGKIFVITGDVQHFKNRKELQAHIEALGGKVTGSVTGKTSYLINNDIDSASSKNKKAKELQVPIITEKDFLDMFGEFIPFDYEKSI